MNIYDNIGCSFEFKNNNIILTGPLLGYLALEDEHIGSTIPYLARNIGNKFVDFEVGTAEIGKEGLALIVTNRAVSASSNDNSYVDFSKNGTKQFYLFVNTANFNTAFNNVSLQNSNFNVGNVKTAYVVDYSLNNNIIADLPNPEDVKSLEIEFRTIGNGSLAIKYFDNFQITLSGNNRYTKLLSTGKSWVELKDENSLRALAIENTDFNVLSNPVGENYSLQYKQEDVPNFGGSKLFWSTDTNQLLFGDVDTDGAKNIIPSSGDYPVIFNQTRDGSDFIVYGTGNSPGYPEKNLYFTSTGKLGINIPSGLKPSTVLHIVNTLCREGIRLENWGSCYPADITLYQNNLTTPTDDSNNASFAQITFVAKNSSNVRRNFAQIVAKRKSVSSSKGELQFIIGDTSSPSNSGTPTIITNPDQTTITHTNSSLSISPTQSNLRLGSSYLGVSSNRINIDAGTINSPINITGIVNVNNRLRLNYINETNSLLAIDSNNSIIAATGFEIPGIHDSFWPYEPENYGSNIGGKDLTWRRHKPKPISVDQLCLTALVSEIALAEPALMEEFVNGDQIAIYNANNKSLQYRKINQVIVSGDAISGMTLDQSINLSGTLSVYSTTRGGVLKNTIFTSGIVSDASNVTISTRPGVSTVFNGGNKNIDFIVYGSENIPAINVLANASTEDRESGIYYAFATQAKDFTGSDVIPFASRIDSNGYGVNNSTNNAVNFREAADIVVWPNRVSAVGTNGKPSYYGTYDQNGNVYEWTEDEISTGSESTHQYVCGGSWRTFFSEGLRGYIPTPRATGLDDIGFRISSQAGFSNPSLESRLGLRFVRIDNPGNLPDPNPVYIEDYDNRFTTRFEPSPYTLNNLGVVNYVYNLSAFEVTNNQYTEFLSSVATGISPVGLYKAEMSSNNAGGITRTGNGSSIPYEYSVKSGMGYMPVVFVDYLSSIRFINWLSNGGQTGETALDSLEVGSYSIEGVSSVISKNKNRGYYLPSVHEWHKAAYYFPVLETVRNPTSAVTIRSNFPHEYSSGQISSLTVSGNIYTDTLKVGNAGSQLLNTFTSGEYYNILLGPDNAVTDTDAVTALTTSYRSFISSTGIQLATSGDITFVNKINPISKTSFTPSGMFVSDKITIASINDDGSIGSGIVITPTGTQILSSSGTVIPGGAVPGPNAGFVFKGIDNDNLFANSRLIVEQLVDSAGTGYYPKISGTPNNSVIYNDINGHLTGSGFFTVGVVPDAANGITSNIVSVFVSDTGLEPATLCANRVLIGPILDTYKGSLLMHNGTGPAIWTQNDFFKAEGVQWTRNTKRAVKFLSRNEIQFIDLDESQGGTGPVSLSEIESEFAYTDSIAVYNKDRSVFYIKVAKTVLVDNAEGYPTEDSLWDTQINQSERIFRTIPPLPEGWVADGQETETTEGPILLGYAFAIQKGAYLSMFMEPSATKAFDIEGVYEDESGLPYPVTRFKPATTNTISMKPDVSTSFNTLAEDIDFSIYGYRKTLLNRYEPEWFDKDSTGLPVGIVPAFRVHSYIENSVSGSIESGVYKETLADTGGGKIASGIYLDLNPKITINMRSPYEISSLTGVKDGLINADSNAILNRQKEKEYGFEIKPGGARISGPIDIANYADLSVGGTTFSNAIISNQVALLPVYTGVVPVPYELSLVERLYVPNYPLTINSYGQVVSLVPPPTPTPPDTPTNIVGVSKNTAIVLTWTAPAKDGGSSILAYVVEYSSNLGLSWTIFDQLDSNYLPAHPDNNTTRTITNLTNDTSYIFRIYAINSIGKGLYSINSDSIVPKNLTPTEPRNILVNGSNAGDLRASINPTVSWTAPSSVPAGRSIVGYDVSYFYDELDSNGQLVSYEQATWIDAGRSTILSKSISNIPIDKYVVFSVVAILDQDIGQGVESPRGIYRSPGTGTDPRNPVVQPPVSTTDYNFGTIIFTGSC